MFRHIPFRVKVTIFTCISLTVLLVLQYHFILRRKHLENSISDDNQEVHVDKLDPKQVLHHMRERAERQESEVKAPDEKPIGIHKIETKTINTKGVESTNNTKQRNIKILYWTGFFRIRDWGVGVGQQVFTKPRCEYDACETTTNKAEFTESDALLIHPPDVFDPTNPQPLPTRHPGHQKWILFLQEAPVTQSFTLRGWNNVINLTQTYRLDSDIDASYDRIIPLEKTAKRPSPSYNYAAKKKKLAVWFVSNCDTHSKREVYAAELQKHMQIDVFGKCGTLSCPKEDPACRQDTIKQYKFYLALENSLCVDYVTEKTFLMYEEGMDTVPVVLGRADYEKVLPPSSYIDVRKFSSPAKLAEYLHHLDTHDEEYNAYFAWKQGFKLDRGGFNLFCELCKYLHTHREETKSYPSMEKWYNVEHDCISPQMYYKGIMDLSLLRHQRRH